MIISVVITATQVCLAACAAESRPMPLTRGGEAVCRIVVLADDPSGRLTSMAVRAIADPVKRWSGVELPLTSLDRNASPEDTKKALASSAVVLVTLGQLERAMPAVVAGEELLVRAAFLDEHGYVRVPAEVNGAKLLLVTGRTPRAVYNGAVHLGETAIDGPANGLTVDTAPAFRSPHLRQRPVYALTIWGEEDEYSADDWMKVFDGLARAGSTDLYFWLSGHFPSQRFPQTYKLKDNNWDSTDQTRIGTLEDQRRLIRRSHELGMRFYLGGALGAWCGTFMLTNRQAGTMRKGSVDESGQDVSEWALCPADERSRETIVAYYKEMFDSLPEADGLYLESADEYGECACERCRVPVDAFGSRMFGQYQLSLVQRLMHAIWRDHPRARLCYTIGYGPHKSDRAYYEIVRQMSADERIEWMEARGAWTFPGSAGEPLSPAYFSPRVLRWDYFDRAPLEPLIESSWRAATSGMSGYIATFSPGFANGSFRHEIPLPLDRLPLLLTWFVYREAAWQPTPNVEDMKQRVGRRFFGRDATKELTDHLWALREVFRGTTNRKIRPPQLQTLAEIEQAARAAHKNARPKAREGLDEMLAAIDDLRRECKPTARPTASSPTSSSSRP
jgi:hypothetical protein